MITVNLSSLEVSEFRLSLPSSCRPSPRHDPERFVSKSVVCVHGIDPDTCVASTHTYSSLLFRLPPSGLSTANWQYCTFAQRSAIGITLTADILGSRAPGNLADPIPCGETPRNFSSMP